LPELHQSGLGRVEELVLLRHDALRTPVGSQPRACRKRSELFGDVFRIDVIKTFVADDRLVDLLLVGDIFVKGVIEIEGIVTAEPD
jgi:hypothetical protein